MSRPEHSSSCVAENEDIRCASSCRAKFADAAPQLRAMRLRSSLTQPALSMRTGLSLQSISAYEMGRRHPSVSQVEALAAACGFSMEDLFAIVPAEDELHSPQPFAAVVVVTRASHRVVDPLAPFLSREDSRYPSLQSSLRGAF